jgi:aminoglycoside phosphotransferase (APT) family kinase protein
VFRNGRVIALIDFDMAAPGRPLWDVAIAAQEWAPLSAPEARRDHPRDLDGVARLRRFARAYGVEPDRASQLVDLIFTERRQALAHIRSEITAGNHSWIDLLAREPRRAASAGRRCLARAAPRRARRRHRRPFLTHQRPQREGQPHAKRKP